MNTSATRETPPTGKSATGPESLSKRAVPILELFEPVFQKVCFLNRAGRKVGSCNYETTRSEFTDLLAGLKKTANGEDRLRHQYEELEKPIVFFLDSMIIESGLDIASRWRMNPLAVKLFDDPNGDEDFFKFLEQTLNEPGSDGDERLAVFYVCLGLGFTGTYKHEPQELQALMARVRQRIERMDLLETDLRARICDGAYYADVVDVKGQKETRTMYIMGCIFLAAILATIITYKLEFKHATRELQKSVENIEKKIHAP